MIQPTTDLYRFYDAADRLLYVGVSLHAAQRAGQHRADKDWWLDVRRMEVEHLPDRETALRREMEIIKTEHPVHNVLHNNVPPRQFTAEEMPICTNEAYALALADGSCPVGLVGAVWWAPAPIVELTLYNWWTGRFDGATHVIDWHQVTRAVRASKYTDGKYTVYDMDPLADFQTKMTKSA